MPHPNRRSVSHWHNGAGRLVPRRRRPCKCPWVGPGRAGPGTCLLAHAGFPPQGCREKTDPFNPNPKDWSAFRSRDYGYTRMQVVNATHLYLEQVSDDQVMPTSSRADLKRSLTPC